MLSLASELNLSDAQKAELQALEAQHKVDRESLREKYNMPSKENKENFRDERRTLRQSFKQQVNEILSDEQESQLKQLHKTRPPRTQK